MKNDIKDSFTQGAFLLHNAVDIWMVKTQQYASTLQWKMHIHILTRKRSVRGNEPLSHIKKKVFYIEFLTTLELSNFLNFLWDPKS